MINPEEIGLSTLPWMPLDATAMFPQRPAIYFAIDSSGVVQYIGLASNAKKRWVSHERYEELASLGDVRIACLFVASIELLPKIEAMMIQRFDPPLNKQGRPKQQCFTDSVDHKLDKDIRAILTRTAKQQARKKRAQAGEKLLRTDGYTVHELRKELEKATNQPIAESTLRRWIDKVCLIGSKHFYSSEDLTLLTQWAFFKERCRSVKTFQFYVFQKPFENRQD